MHIKALATGKAYALGSYNWTALATNENDELLEIGSSAQLVQTYHAILTKLIDLYPEAETAAADAEPAGIFDISEASEHVGQTADVRGARCEKSR